MAQIILVGWSLLIGICFYLQYGGDASALGLLRSWLVAFLLVLASIGFGARLMMHQDRSWDTCFVVGLLGWGTLLLPISALGGLHLSSIFWLPMLYWVWRLRREIEWPNLTRHWLPFVAYGGVVFWVVSHSSVDTDALYYHVSLPKQMWMQNGLLGGELKPNGSRPLLFHLPLSQVYGLGDLLAVGFFCGMISLLFSLSLILRTEGIRKGSSWFVGLLLLGSFSFWEQSSVPANNIMTGFVVWITFWAALKPRRGWLGILMGLSVAMKYTSAGVVVAIWLMAKIPQRQKVKEASLAICVAGVWLIRNWLEGVHPLFPYAGWELDMPFVFVEKYGMGRDWIAMAMLPWNVIMNAEVDQFQFLGRLSPLFLFALPFGIWTGIRHSQGRKLLFITLVGWIFWALGPHWIRHLFPMMGLLIFALAISMDWQRKGVRLASFLAFGLGLFANWNPYAQRYVGLFDDNVQAPGERAVRWINEHTSPTDEVAYLFAWSGSRVDRRYVLGSVEDHTPVRHWLLSRQDTALRDLYNDGVRYVLVGPHRFLHKSYSFLSKEEFVEQFEKPIEILEDLLLKESRLVYTDSGYEVYQLVKD